MKMLNASAHAKKRGLLPDIVDSETRSRMMSGIRGKDTKPEHLVRCGLHARGLRFRLHARNIPGKPDLVFPRFHAVVFVNGCFWHGHDCHLFRLPGTRTEFWQDKFETNRRRDSEVRDQLEKSGWRHLTIWECAIRGRRRRDPEGVLDIAAAWIRNPRSHSTGIRGGDK